MLNISNDMLNRLKSCNRLLYYKHFRVSKPNNVYENQMKIKSSREEKSISNISLESWSDANARPKHSEWKLTKKYELESSLKRKEKYKYDLRRQVLLKSKTLLLSCFSYLQRANISMHWQRIINFPFFSFSWSIFSHFLFYFFSFSFITAFVLF